MTDPAHEELTREFWEGTGLENQFPRPIERAVHRKLPILVIHLPVVGVEAVETWLRGRSVPAVLPKTLCDLMGCLYAHRGVGFIFVCGADEPDEQRFTVAHDTAHFLVDYWRPRQQVLSKLGKSAAAVLDGDRLPGREELAAAALARVRLGPHVHLLARPGREESTDPRLARVEERADALGLELVAPAVRIAEVLRGPAPRNQENREVACRALAEYFGVPAYVFDRILPRRLARKPSFLEEVVLPMRRQS